MISDQAVTCEAIQCQHVVQWKKILAQWPGECLLSLQHRRATHHSAARRICARCCCACFLTRRSRQLLLSAGGLSRPRAAHPSSCGRARSTSGGGGGGQLEQAAAAATGITDRTRFVVELEFIQCLSNPFYLNCERGGREGCCRLKSSVPGWRQAAQCGQGVERR